MRILLSAHFNYLFGLLVLVSSAYGTKKCVWIRGQLKCNKDPTKHQTVEIRLYDRDGLGPLKVFDPDDLMGITFSDHEGAFQLDGCGDDFNWIPGIANVPDPFIRIFHYCNEPKGEQLELPEFYTFVPETYQTGVIDLDKDLSSSSEKSETNPKSFGSPSFVKNDSSMHVLNGDKHEKLDSNESLRSENGSLLNKEKYEITNAEKLKRISDEDLLYVRLNGKSEEKQ